MSITDARFMRSLQPGYRQELKERKNQEVKANLRCCFCKKRFKRGEEWFGYDSPASRFHKACIMALGADDVVVIQKRTAETKRG